ncbi:MAG: hypothetical protein KJ000_23565 [Pirellulaceae bacterium]|nr:hypothetical protein [Pirellulaceae bacterium]
MVLSEAVASAVGERRVKAAVFATFEFEPEFFELNVLPCLFPNVAWSQMPNVKRMQIGKALTGIEHVAVIYDQRGLKPAAGSARLDYERIAVTPSRGVFHAKNIFLLLENQPELQAGPDGVDESLVLVTTSANLTRNGWHENVEIAQVLEIAAGESNAIRDDLLGQGGVLTLWERQIPGRVDGTSQPAIEAIRQFLKRHVETPAHRKHQGFLRPRLYGGQQPFDQFLCKEGRIVRGQFRLEIVSPFFEDTAEALTLADLLAAIHPVETRIYLPRDDDGAARCSADYFQAIERLQQDYSIHWACLPDELTRWSRKGDGAKHRNVHAKVYRLFQAGRVKDDWRDLQVIGSVNLTRAAHAGYRQGNFESAVLVDLPCDRRPEWWLSPLDSLPANFRPPSSEEQVAGLACHALVLRFDWQEKEKQLEYYWQSKGRGPARASVQANGITLFEFQDIVFSEWRRLDSRAAQTIQDRLTTSSLVELLTDDGPPQPLLVQEVNMAMKPSLLEQLTAAEILEYWSLLTPDQRNEFLEGKLTTLIQQAEQGKTERLPDEVDSFFDRFAGVFHAFSCLEEYVLDALQRDARKEVQYRLLGKDYDSLPTLAAQVQDDKDPVVAYITLLRATQVFKNLRKQVAASGIQCDFLEQNRRRCDQFAQHWTEACNKVRERIQLDHGTDPEKFFTWYERHFG